MRCDPATNWPAAVRFSRQRPAGVLLGDTGEGDDHDLGGEGERKC
jgi:hypothetical protein